MVGRTKDRGDERHSRDIVFNILGDLGVSSCVRHCSRFLSVRFFSHSKGPLEQREDSRRTLRTVFFSFPPLPLPLFLYTFLVCEYATKVGRREKALPREKHTQRSRARRRSLTRYAKAVWKLDRPMLGEHLSATSRDGHTTRQLMLRHGCTRAVTPPTAFLSRRCVWRLLSLIFRCSDSAFNRETIWRGWKLWRRWCFEKVGVWREKSFFFLLGITRESGRELSKGDCSCRWLTKKLCNPSFIFPFSRAFDDCKISLSEILGVQKRLGGNRFERTRFRSPVDERSRNNRDKQIIRAATTQWNNVQPRSATDESISTLFSLRKASILEKCSYL